MQVTNRFRNVIVWIGTVTILAMIIWLVPKAVSIYFLGRGSRLLNQTLSQFPTAEKSDFFCIRINQLNEQNQRGLEFAAINLARATRLDNRNSRSFLLLGRVNCLVGEYEKAVEALSRYVALRPNNPEGHLELGLAYLSAGEISKAVEEIERSNFSIRDVWMYALMNEIQLSEQFPRMVFDPNLDQPPPSSDEYILAADSLTSTDGWIPYILNSNGEFFIQEGILTMRFNNNPEKRDQFAFTKDLRLPIKNLNHLDIRIRGDGQTLFTLEAVIDSNRVRILDYEKINESWDLYSLPIQGDLIEEITLSIGEKEDNPTQATYGVLIDWLAIR